MAQLQTNHAAFSGEMVTKVGSAAGRVALIQQEYATQAETETATEVCETLATKAQADARKAIDEQGISVQDYNAVLTAAQNDEDLERRLLDAARQVL